MLGRIRSMTGDRRGVIWTIGLASFGSIFLLSIVFFNYNDVDSRIIDSFVKWEMPQVRRYAEQYNIPYDPRASAFLWAYLSVFTGLNIFPYFISAWIFRRELSVRNYLELSRSGDGIRVNIVLIVLIILLATVMVLFITVGLNFSRTASRSGGDIFSYVARQKGSFALTGGLIAFLLLAMSFAIFMKRPAIKRG